MIHLGQSADGRLIMASNHALPSDVKRVEYYREQKMFMFVYEDNKHEDELMPCEMSDDVHEIIRVSPKVIVVAMAQEGEEPYGYETSLIQIGL